jgi:peptidyl-prolyl cis-trans isomerase C
MIYRAAPQEILVFEKLIKDPLTHFLLAGAAIFAVSYWLNPPEPDATAQITVSATDVAKMRNTIALMQGRPATDEEVNALIEVRIREEVMVREALAAGLDRDDTVVRNRLIEKMRFLTENVVEPPPPADDELEAYFAAQAERFHIPALVTFEHVFFGTERRGERTRADAAAALPGLRKLRDPLTTQALAKLGDPLPLWNRYESMTLSDVALAFGDEFAAGLTPLEPGNWQGPLQSRFGWHPVRVIERSSARQPALAEIRDAVLMAWLNEKRQAENEARYREMRERYNVVVEAAGAAPTEPESGPTDVAPVQN